MPEPTPPLSPLTPDLDAYFTRIDYSGPRAATLEALRGLHFAHVCRVPFENLDVLLGRGVRIDLPSVEEKLVRQRRGGYCFEQNTLFCAVLRALGFSVTPLLARVRWQAPAQVRTGLTHMVLRVDLEGRPWLADVGFGGIGSTAPLALDTTDEQPTSHDLRRFVFQGHKVTQQVRVDEGWGDVYEFTLEEPGPMDFEMGNWFSCSHPKAHFMNQLVVTRVAPDGRVIIFNREFTVRDRDGLAEKREIASPAELLTLLARHFDLHFPASTRFNPPAAPWPADV